jgi:hypothetical protein
MDWEHSGKLGKGVTRSEFEDSLDTLLDKTIERLAGKRHRRPDFKRTVERSPDFWRMVERSEHFLDGRQ